MTLVITVRFAHSSATPHPGPKAVARLPHFVPLSNNARCFEFLLLEAAGNPEPPLWGEFQQLHKLTSRRVVMVLTSRTS